MSVLFVDEDQFNLSMNQIGKVHARASGSFSKKMYSCETWEKMITELEKLCGEMPITEFNPNNVINIIKQVIMPEFHDVIAGATINMTKSINENYYSIRIYRRYPNRITEGWNLTFYPNSEFREFTFNTMTATQNAFLEQYGWEAKIDKDGYVKTKRMCKTKRAKLRADAE